MAAAYEPIGEAPRRPRWYFVATAVVVAAGVVVIATNLLPAFTMRPSTAPKEEGLVVVLHEEDDDNSRRTGLVNTESSSWHLYKVAVAARVGDAGALRRFVNATLAYTYPDLDLGCGGVKVDAALLPAGPQLHWVESAVLASDPKPIAVWEAYFDDLNADMSRFNAFMHNKITMFTTDLAPFLVAFRAQNKTFLRRRSTTYAHGRASPIGQVAHVVFALAGRAYELVAPVAATNAYGDDAWPEWSASECEPAHRLDSDLDKYADAYDAYVRDAEPETAAWAAERGYYPPMFASVGVALGSISTKNQHTSDSDDLAAVNASLFPDLAAVAGLEAYLERQTATCAVYRLPTVSSKGFKGPVRYVVNRASVVGGDGPVNNAGVVGVAEYNAYVLATHKAITGAHADWAGWDHWLDQHIGLKYVGTETRAVAATLNARLVARGLPVGQRTTDTYGDEDAVHWYTGYPGPMTWEYWVPNCAWASTNHQADVCACTPENNDRLFYDATGRNCTDVGTWFPLRDDDDDA
mmetsp:Transcript_19547/g.77765  ORF Transcript_19547/g.77765 Transcript_19547/m.77765 type:complete len:522 (-) Transcript_19547:72-1637(-)